jgi:hypothetical protein
LMRALLTGCFCSENAATRLSMSRRSCAQRMRLLVLNVGKLSLLSLSLSLSVDIFFFNLALFLLFCSHLLIDTSLPVGLSSDSSIDHLFYSLAFSLFSPLIFLLSQDTLWVSVASVAYQLQILVMYVFSAIEKSGADWRLSANAAYVVLHQKFFSTGGKRRHRRCSTSLCSFTLFSPRLSAFPPHCFSAGSLLLHFPLLLYISTMLVLYWEMLAPWTLLVPSPRARLAFVASAWLMHLSFAVALRLELLFWAPVVALVPLLPSVAWNWWLQRYGKSRRPPVVLHVDLESWLGSRIHFFFHTFMLADASVSWTHLDGAETVSGADWLVITCQPKVLC